MCKFDVFDVDNYFNQHNEMGAPNLGLAQDWIRWVNRC